MIGIPSIVQIPVAVARALKDTWDQMTEIFTDEHDEDGHHTDITAKSLTLTEDPETGATGDVTAQDGTFKGNVTADSDGAAADISGPVVIGLHVQVGGVRTGSGVDIQGATRWRIITFSPGSNDRELLFQDVAAGAPYSINLKWRNALSAYVLHPEVANPLHLGLDGPGTRIAKLFITVNSIYESGRTAALGEWTAFTPTWTAATANPALGNGTLTGAYALIGKTVHFQITLSAGGTTTFGTGAWSFTLPQTGTATTIINGSVLAFDSSAGQFWNGHTFLATTTTCGVFDNASPAAQFTSAVPFAWATGDSLFLTGTYEMA